MGHMKENRGISVRQGTSRNFFEMIAFERPVIVTGSPLYSVFSISELELVEEMPRVGEVASNEVVACCSGRLRAGRYFLHEHPKGASSWTDLVWQHCKIPWEFSLYSHRCVAFKPKGVNKFVYKPTKRVTKSKVLAKALERRCSNSSEPPSHRHTDWLEDWQKWHLHTHPSL